LYKDLPTRSLAHLTDISYILEAVLWIRVISSKIVGIGGEGK